MWELENAEEGDQLFVTRIRKILGKYGLPTPESVLTNPPLKGQWKLMVKKLSMLIGTLFGKKKPRKKQL